MMTSFLRRRALLPLLFALLASVLVVPRAHAATTLYVATNGSDSNAGTLNQPWRTITKGLRSLKPGDTLYVRGGTYTERVTGFTLPSGTSSARITVKAYSGERPIVKGLLWLKGANYWTFDGINVTWDSNTGRSNEHMLKLIDGTGWVYTNAEVWGARSFAAILIAGAPASYKLSYLKVHDTYATNDKYQDHLIYVNSYAGGTGGVIERNLLWNSPNGRAIKVGPSSSSGSKVGKVTIRYNTMFNNPGPANINLSYNTADVRIERNIMQKVAERYANVSATSLSGSNNVALNNVGWASTRVVATGFSGLKDGGGNLWINPQLRAPTNGDFYPTNRQAQAYGVYAP